MSAIHYCRYRMELRIADRRVPEPELPEGYFWLPWHPALFERHARVKLASFVGAVDSRVFPNLRNIEGCRRLMRGIVDNEFFSPQATWLLGFDDGFGRPRDCGTIQGLAFSGGVGTIQNVGVVPEHRGHGLGRALIFQTLRGFQMARLRTARLEVTADNRRAVALYQSLGFRLVQTSFKEVEEKPVSESQGVC
ncbi:MAG: N-acetyltransferase [Planctomycetaceae bacterium]